MRPIIMNLGKIRGGGIKSYKNLLLATASRCERVGGVAYAA